MARVALMCLVVALAAATSNAAPQNADYDPQVLDALAASELALANLEKVLRVGSYPASGNPRSKRSNSEVVDALARSELALANLEEVLQGQQSLGKVDLNQYPRSKRWVTAALALGGGVVGGFLGSWYGGGK